MMIMNSSMKIVKKIRGAGAPAVRNRVNRISGVLTNL